MKKQILLSSKPLPDKFRRRADREFEWGIPLCDVVDGIDIKNFLPEYLQDEGMPPFSYYLSLIRVHCDLYACNRA